MNWYNKIKQVLGSFWLELFNGQDLISWLCSLYTKQASLTENRLEAFTATNDINNDSKQQVAEEFEVLLVCASIDLSTGEESQGILPEAVSIADCINSDLYSLCEDSPRSYYTAHEFRATKTPYKLLINTGDSSITLTRGVDFSYQDGLYTFGFDIRELGIPQVYISTDAVMHRCYSMMGVCEPVAAIKEQCLLTDTGCLSDYAKDIWRMQCFGASLYDIKKLLGSVSGSVVCESEAVVSHRWVEQGFQHLLIADKVYSAPVAVACNVEHGDNVKPGDVLFGDFKFYDSLVEQVPYDDVPGLKVRCDAGQLTLLNKLDDAVNIGGVNMLPVTFVSDAVKSAYYARCLQARDDKEYPVPARVNPFDFVRKLRGHRAAIAVVDNKDDKMTSSALEHIRNTVDAGCIFTVYLKAPGDAIKLQLGSFTASSGNAAVASVAAFKLSGTAKAINTFV